MDEGVNLNSKYQLFLSISTIFYRVEEARSCNLIFNMMNISTTMISECVAILKCFHDLLLPFDFAISAIKCLNGGFVLLPAATKLGQGNIFTSVCLSTGGGVWSGGVWSRGTPIFLGGGPPNFFSFFFLFFQFFFPKISSGMHKLRQGNVFTGVCDSVHGRGGCLPQCMLGYTRPT